MVSPFSTHQQQLAMLAQQQSLVMAAAANSAGGNPKFPGGMQQPRLNGSNIPVPSWPTAGYPIPGLPMNGQGGLQKLVQVLTLGRNELMIINPFLFVWQLNSSSSFCVRLQAWLQHIQQSVLCSIQHLGMSLAVLIVLFKFSLPSKGLTCIILIWFFLKKNNSVDYFNWFEQKEI